VNARHRLVLCFVVLLGLTVPATSTAAQASCSFTLGFKTLRDIIADQYGDRVGLCLENEHFETATGNSLQRTSGGLLVWRKADNWTAFTDGGTTWLNGPEGLASRPNSGPTFPWESAAPASPPPPFTVPPGRAQDPTYNPNSLDGSGPLCFNEPPVSLVKSWQVSAPRGWPAQTKIGESVQIGLRNKFGEQGEEYEISVRVVSPSSTFSTARGILRGSDWLYFTYPRDFDTNSGQGSGIYTIVWESRSGFIACDGYVVQANFEPV
jgi:hypothetical protein